MVERYSIYNPGRSLIHPNDDYVLASDYDALAAELARCRSANVYDGAAHKRVAELEAEVEALKHDLEKSMANHVADINGFESERPGVEK